MTNKTPEHYKFKIEPLTFITENNLSFIVGNIIKYVCRYDKKDGVKDLLKAKDYLKKLIETETLKSNLRMRDKEQEELRWFIDGMCELQERQNASALNEEDIGVIQTKVIAK